VTPGLLGCVEQRREVLVAGLAVSAACIATRIVWSFPAAYVPLALFPAARRREGGYPSPRNVLVVSWAGVRGVVSLAAALSLPPLMVDGRPFPGREELVVCAVVVVLTTLFVQGSTLVPLIRLLGIRGGDDSAEEVRRAREAALVAGIERLDAFCSERSCPIAVFHLRAFLQDELETLRDADKELRDRARSRVAVSREVRQAVVLAQRARLLRLRDRGQINDRTYTELLLDLDRTALGTGSG